MADGGNQRIVDMIEVVDNFFKPRKTMGEVMDEVAIARDRTFLQLRLSDMDNKLRELSEKVEELKSQIAEVGK